MARRSNDSKSRQAVKAARKNMNRALTGALSKLPGGASEELIAQTFTEAGFEVVALDDSLIWHDANGTELKLSAPNKPAAVLLAGANAKEISEASDAKVAEK
jgi:hypothetical protein